MAIKLHFLVNTSLPERQRLKAFITQMFTKERKKVGELSYVFCSDPYLLDINNRFLQHNYLTDIISFDLSPNNDHVDAEIFISTDRIKENAVLYKQSFQMELHRVIFHGVLHLLGYKDKTERDKKLMREKEDFYLNLYFSVSRSTVSS